MLKSLELTHFRGFSELKASDLARVNLFVGLNNAGKTTVLEGVEILASGSPAALYRSPTRRRERVLAEREDEETFERELDPSHLFFGHDLTLGNTFRLSSTNQQEAWVTCEVKEFDPDTLLGESLGPSSLLRKRLASPSLGPILTLFFTSHLFPDGKAIPLSVYGGLPGGMSSPEPFLRLMPRNWQPHGAGLPESDTAVQFVGAELATPFQLGLLWDSIVLTPEEEAVARALRIIEPAIERIAFVGEPRTASRSIFLKLSGTNQRIPLGSVGDGLKRLLALTLHLLSARGGYLLVDEIDTGLHYTVMTDMWRLVIETARRLDVQVFATTHSQDCVHALAWVQSENPELATDVLLHRIDRERPLMTTFSADEIAVAARHDLEVR